METAGNENELEKLFVGCGFKFYIKQNCATNEAHFNVIFSALKESEVKTLANLIQRKV